MHPEEKKVAPSKRKINYKLLLIVLINCGFVLAIFNTYRAHVLFQENQELIEKNINSMKLHNEINYIQDEILFLLDIIKAQQNNKNNNFNYERSDENVKQDI